MTIKYTNVESYRTEIDGLRAIAVIAVIAFHLGSMPNGYLGVDVFFVISGYLITGIIYREMQHNEFSLFDFYMRRIRRILPLTLFVVLVALLIGLMVMLPDDLENLAQSVVATNLFGNNLLQAITTKNYWDVVNDYKPLMHTWSLGIEEQYYVIFPLLLLLIGKNHQTWILPVLMILGGISLLLYFLPVNGFIKFYYLPFRFFELATGGMAALYLKDKIIICRYSSVFLIGLIVLLIFGNDLLPRNFLVPAIVIFTLAVIVTDNEKSSLSSLILKNRLFVAIGLISFSLYMWHQVVFAYAKYFLIQQPELRHILLMLVVIVMLSVFSYLFIEKPFRNKKLIDNSKTLLILVVVFIITTLSSLHVYSKGGVIRDVPELGITQHEGGRNIHAKYNEQVHDLDRPFSNDVNKIKVLVVGNSFARDWVNVLLESKYHSFIELSYVARPYSHADFQSRYENADIIFYYRVKQNFINKLGLDSSKLFVLGSKSFGENNGYFYNYSGKDYFQQRAIVDEWLIKQNDKLRETWGDQYIDLFAKIIDENNTVPVFTDDKMFISQDCRHFTQAGARYFARLFDDELAKIFKR